ncbi:MAG: nitrilase-related carbon-nitrogen hydrolase [Saprospiraceae bacterium]
MANSIKNQRLSAVFLLVAGSILIFFTFMRFGIGELGWVVYAPLLVFIFERPKLKQYLALFATLVVAYILTVSKMVTSEIPWAPVPMFAIPMAFTSLLSLSVAGMAYRRLGASWSVYTFASMMTVMGWIQYSFTPGASWGILANTQINNLPLIQLAALTGLGGITFILSLGSGLAAAAWKSGFNEVRKHIAAFAVILFCVLLYGHFRLSETAPGKMIRVGGAVSPVTHKEFYSALENIDTLRLLDNELFARTERAAELGAKVVIWNEVATVVTMSGEQSFVSRAQELAKRKGVLLCMAYAVAVSTDPFYYVNKYRIYLPDGTMADEYIKRHPVPGDQHDAGFAHARVVSFEGINFSGGICYDYSFPEIARDNANDGAEVALIPASDWRGIDREHSRMARMSTVAAGLPMIRPVRAAESIACDQYGRLLGSLPWSSSADGVFVVALPAARVPTIYAMTGEIVPLLALAFVILVIVMVLRSKKVELLT